MLSDTYLIIMTRNYEKLGAKPKIPASRGGRGRGRRAPRPTAGTPSASGTPPAYGSPKASGTSPASGTPPASGMKTASGMTPPPSERQPPPAYGKKTATAPPPSNSGKTHERLDFYRGRLATLRSQKTGDFDDGVLLGLEAEYIEHILFLEARRVDPGKIV